ncbi:MAG: hypothetical protein ACK4R9_05695 [Ignavibacterium sp.]
MKKLFFFFVPFFLFAQSSHPDKLYLIDNREFPCTVTSVDTYKERVEFFYGDNKQERIGLNAVDKLEIENFGVIYQKSTGFTVNINEVQSFLKKRNEKSALFNKSLELSEKTSLANVNQHLNDKKWSVGLTLIPYYSGENYRISYNVYPENIIYIITNSFNEINLEWYLNYSVSKKFDVTFDFSYSSDYSERRMVTSENTDYGNTNSGSFVKSGMRKINIHLGVKYYLFDKKQEDVSVYFLAGFGRQFAFSEESVENLFPRPNDPVREDNMEEFLEDINSPWHINAGFGTEYFLNNSVSLTSVIRFFYASSSGKFKVREISQYYRRTSELETTISKVMTRIGIGLNFYF